MRVYISGRMTNCPDLNRSAFAAAEKRLTAQGHFVINPVNIFVPFGSAEDVMTSFNALYLAECLKDSKSKVMLEDLAYNARLARAVMDADLAAVRSCDAIYLLRGWESSRGARKELAEALAHGLVVVQEGGGE